ncbi:MAG: tetratricopeptide repeat protein [Pseudomonadales bacterium]
MPAEMGKGQRADDPEAYIARDRRRAIATGQPLPDRVWGSAVFADISGFTALTEALVAELGPQRGPEALTEHLDRVFHAIIDSLDRFGGNVIYFSGDAITAWIDGDDGRRAVAGALAMQAAMTEVGRVVTGGGAVVDLALKVAIAGGEVRRAVVGDPSIQRLDVLAGSLLDVLAGVERQAGSGEILVDESTLDALGDVLTVARRLRDPDSGRRLGLVSGLQIVVPEARTPEPPPLPPDVVRQWLLPVVYERITAGRGEFLAELRSAYPVFLRFGGLDFDADDGAIDELKHFVARAQHVFDRYGGSLLQITLGDKGAYLYGVFGSPVAHEDDAARAATAALELVALEASAAVTGIQVGIAHGALRSGTYGHDRRRTFVCLGDAVNVAARLMSKAPAGRIYVTADVRAAAGDAFVWRDLEPLVLKGKARPMPAAELASSLASVARRRTRYELPMFGRDRELAALEAAFGHAEARRGRIVGVSAEAGLGKSRLVAEFVRGARRREVLVAFGECQSFGVNTSYFVWREIWRRLLNVDESDDVDGQRSAAEAALRRIDPSLLPRAPLLGDVLGVSLPDNELTAGFDAKLRKSSLEDLLVTCLRERSTREPLVVVLEDCHWIDALSRDLLKALARATDGHRLLFLLAYRPAAAPGGQLGLEALPHFQELPLQMLNAEQMRAVIGAKAAHVFDLEAPPEVLVDLVTARAEGNPFYAEELLNFVASRGVRPDDARALSALSLPESLHSLILSRIDALAEDPRRTLKVASVIGRLFRAPALPGVYPDLGPVTAVRDRLSVLCDQDLVTLDQAETEAYLFRHVVTQEVSYQSMPFAMRSGLHRRVGTYIEATEAEDLEPHLDLLAHHFWLGDDDARKRLYLKRAEASARRRYANESAIEYGERLLTLTAGDERAEVLLGMGKVLELIGDWGRAAAVAREARELAAGAGNEGRMARCDAALAEVARKQGHYDEATELLARAADTFRRIGDEEGLGLALHVSGTIAAQRGDFDAARRAYQESLEIRARLADQTALASLHSNLAIVAQYSGDYAEARAASQRGLDIRRAVGDRWGIGVSLNNIGMIAFLERNHGDARRHFEEAITLCREVGDPWMVALARNNLGNALRELGEHAAACENYAASLETYRRNDDLWALAFLLEDMAVAAAQMDAGAAAFALLGAGERLREEIGSPRTPEQEADLAAAFLDAHRALGAAGAEAATRRGRGWSRDEAIDQALGFARGTATV